MNNRIISYAAADEDESLQVDDMTDDVASAYQEARDRANGEERQEPAPVRTEERSEAREDDRTPDNQTQEQKDRDERGRFKPKAAKEGEAAAPVPGAEAAATGQPEGAQAPSIAAPPPSWSPRAKAAWEQVPENVRAEIAKREVEVAQGFKALADYKDLKPYAELATQHNTTISKALDHYLAVDRLMKQDLAGGMATVAESYGLPKEQIGKVFAELAQRYGAQVSATPAPSNGQSAALSEEDPLAALVQPFLEPFIKELNELKSHHTQRVEQDRNSQVQSLASEITKFSADPKNIFYADVEKDIIRIFNKGLIDFSGNPAQDLQTAYDFAIWQNPETRAALIEKQVAGHQGTQRQKEQKVTDKARQASRSMGGSKIPGTVITKDNRGANEPDDIEADVRAAYRQHSAA